MNNKVISIKDYRKKKEQDEQIKEEWYKVPTYTWWQLIKRAWNHFFL